MYKTEKVVVRLDRRERSAVERLARLESLPLATLARTLLLREAERRGLWPLERSVQEVEHDGQKQ